MTKVYRNHIAQMFIDLGAIGEQECDVVYDEYAPIPSSDPYLAPENGGIIVTAVMAFIDGKEVNIFPYLSNDLITDLELEIAG